MELDAIANAYFQSGRHIDSREHDPHSNRVTANFQIHKKGVGVRGREREREKQREREKHILANFNFFIKASKVTKR